MDGHGELIPEDCQRNKDWPDHEGVCQKPPCWPRCPIEFFFVEPIHERSKKGHGETFLPICYAPGGWNKCLSLPQGYLNCWWVQFSTICQKDLHRPDTHNKVN